MSHRVVSGRGPAQLEPARALRVILLGFGPAHCGPKQSWPKVSSGQIFLACQPMGQLWAKISWDSKLKTVMIPQIFNLFHLEMFFNVLMNIFHCFKGIILHEMLMFFLKTNDFDFYNGALRLSSAFFRQNDGDLRLVML